MNAGLSTRDRLIQSAIQAFASRGFDGASTRQIATMADANQGLITHYFGTKEALWREAMALCFTRLDVALREDTACGDARQQLRHQAHAFVRFSAKHPEVHRLILDVAGQPGPRLDWLVEHQLRPRLAPILSELGHHKSGPAAHLLFAFVGAGTHAFAVAPLVQQVTGTDLTKDAAAHAYADFLVDLFLGSTGGS